MMCHRIAKQSVSALAFVCVLMTLQSVQADDSTGGEESASTSPTYIEWAGFRFGGGLVGVAGGFDLGARVATIRWHHVSWTVFEFNLQTAGRDLRCADESEVGIPSVCESTTGFLDLATRLSVRSNIGPHKVWIGLGAGLLIEDDQVEGVDTDPTSAFMVSPSLEYVHRATSGLLLGADLRATFATSGGFTRTPFTLTAGLRIGFDGGPLIRQMLRDTE